MIKHLEESTDTVKSNKTLIYAVLANIILIAIFVVLNIIIPFNYIFLIAAFCLIIISSTFLFYQIIKRF